MKDDSLGLTHDELCEMFGLPKESSDELPKDLIDLHQKLGTFTINGVKIKRKKPNPDK